MRSNLQPRLTRRQTVGVAAGLLAAGWARSAQAQQPPAPSLVMVAEDVYAWSNSGYTTLFIITNEGVVTGDPIGGVNPQNPALVKAAIESVTDQPVRYVFYSHDTADHSTGGAIFADTADFIAQLDAGPKIAARGDPNSPEPTILFEEQLVLQLGDKELHFIYPGLTTTPNNAVLYYPAGKVLYAVDFLEVRRLPFRSVPEGNPVTWVEALDWIEANLDFETLVTGHTGVGTRDNLPLVRSYWYDLFAAVDASRAEGAADGSDEMHEAVRLAMASQYGDWGNFNDHLPLNVEAVLRAWSETEA